VSIHVDVSTESTASVSRTTRPLPGDGHRWEVAALAGLAVCLLGIAFIKPFRPDEIEHVHAAWRVANGRVPYLDFFEHHHPLLWYMLAGLLRLVGESGATVLIFRLIFYLLALATLGVTWGLALRVTRSRSVAWLSALLLVSTTSFLEASIMVRPDVPMMLFVALSVLFFVRAIEGRRRVDAVVSGVAAGVAIAFLQKAVFLLIAFAALAAVRRVRSGRWVPGATVAWFGAGLGVTMVAAGGYLAAIGAMRDYFWTTWLFNVMVTAELPRFPTTGSGLVVNAPFWCLACGGAGVLLWRQWAEDALTTVAVIACAILGCLIVTRALRLHYLLQSLPLLAVVAAWALHGVFERLALASRQRFAAVFLLALAPVVGRVLSIKSTNWPQQAAIDYVLTHSGPHDPMHDPALQFNLFRPDLHYFGDLPTDQRRVVGWYRRVAGARFAGYDACALIDVKRPRFVSDAEGQLETCGLSRRYRKTLFAGLYERLD